MARIKSKALQGRRICRIFRARCRVYFKKTCLLSLALIILTCAFATAYTSPYLETLTPDLSAGGVDVYSATYAGSRYFICKDAGGLLSSEDGVSWHEVAGMDDAYIVGDGKTESEKLVVFSGDTLYACADGQTFEAIKKFGAQTIVHCTEGIYAAMVWSGDDTQESRGGQLYVSFDLYNWTKVPAQPISNSGFYIKRHGEAAIISNIMLPGGTVSAVVSKDGVCRLFGYNTLSYDYASGQYVGMVTNSERGTVKFAVSQSPDALFSELAFDSAGNTSCYIGLFDTQYYMSVYDYASAKNTYYQSADGVAWHKTDTMYYFFDSRENGDGTQTQIYNKVTQGNGGSEVYSTVIRRGNTDGWKRSEVIGNYTLQTYGDVYTYTKMAQGQDYPVFSGLVSRDGITYYQTDAQRAYAITNLYLKRGNFLFADSFAETGYALGADSRPGMPFRLYKVKADPFDGIAQNGIEVLLDGKYIIFDQPPIISNDRTLVPLRGIAEAMGAQVQWDGDMREITLEKDGMRAVLTVDSDAAAIITPDGAQASITLEAPATIINDRTMVPVRFIAETFGVDTAWDAEQCSVVLTGRK